MKPIYRIILVSALLLFIAGVGAGIYMFTLKAPDVSKAKPEFMLTASDLLVEFENGETAALAKYMNKIIEVTGEVASISPGSSEAYSVTLKTGNDLSSVICTLVPGSIPAEVNPGMVVTIRGECSGYLMDVLLNNCIVVK